MTDRGSVTTRRNYMRSMITRVAAALCFVISFLPAPSGITAGVAAENYPRRPIRIVVPFPPGGPTDILMRVIAQRMSELWAEPVVVENQPGANTAIAAARVAKMPPDGYTLLAAMDVTMVLNPITNRNLAYDPVKDFAPITLASKNTSLLSVRADDGPKSVKELIARAKANPGKLNYGAGIITTRLAGYLFNREAGIEVQYIPFSGSAPTVQGLLTGAVITSWMAPQPACRSLRAANCGRWRSSTAALCRRCRMFHPLPQRPGFPRSTTSRPGLGLLRPPARRARTLIKFAT